MEESAEKRRRCGNGRRNLGDLRGEEGYERSREGRRERISRQECVHDVDWRMKEECTGERRRGCHWRSSGE